MIDVSLRTVLRCMVLGLRDIKRVCRKGATWFNFEPLHDHFCLFASREAIQIVVRRNGRIFPHQDDTDIGRSLMVWVSLGPRKPRKQLLSWDDGSKHSVACADDAFVQKPHVFALDGMGWTGWRYAA